VAPSSVKRDGSVLIDLTDPPTYLDETLHRRRFPKIYFFNNI